MFVCVCVCVCVARVCVARVCVARVCVLHVCAVLHVSAVQKFACKLTFDRHNIMLKTKKNIQQIMIEGLT